MLNYIVFDNQIKVWWEYRKLDKVNEYTIFLNSEAQAKISATNYSFKNLKPNCEYKIEVKLGEEIIGEDTIKTNKEKRKIDVTKSPYNAVGDGKTLNTLKLQKAIDDCNSGECVYFPKGEYLSGALFLHSNMEIMLDDEAVLQGTANPQDYPKILSRFEGIEDQCYSSIINVGELDHCKGYTTENVIIRGGKIFSGGQELRKNIIAKEKEVFQEIYRENGASEQEINSNLVCNILPGRKRGRCMQVSNTRNFVLADCECGLSPSWNLHFIYCKDIITCGCNIKSKGISNGDGWDPDSSVNCICFDTVFDTGDDCVAIKSGKNPEGNEINRPCEQIKVFDVIASGGWGIAIGSEMSGGVEDVKIWNANLKYTSFGFIIKSPIERGGYVRKVEFKNSISPMVKISQEKYYNLSTEDVPESSTIEDVCIKDLYLGGIDYFDSGKHNWSAIALIAKDLGKIKNVSISDITLNKRKFTPNQEFYFKNVLGVTIKNISFK